VIVGSARVVTLVDKAQRCRSTSSREANMTKLRVGLLACLATGAALMLPGPALANNVRCENEALPAVNINGNLVVPSGAFCNLNGTHVTGNATVKAGPPEPSEPTSLSSNGATIDGNVNVQQNAQFAAFTGSTIGGNVHCNQCEVADVQDSTVKGNQLDNGVSEGAFIRNSHIFGNLRIHHGTDFFATGFHIDGNTIGGNLEFNQNTGLSDISGNKVTGNLQCNNNMPPPTGGGNTARQLQGQCALLF
jgi:hypothetical protein